MRGRLIYPFTAVLQQVDATATAADPDGAGDLTSGWDDVFREPVLLDSADKLGDKATVLGPEISLPCQVEPQVQDALVQIQTGNAANLFMDLFFHFRDLETQGYVDADGNATLRVSDRLVRIVERRSGNTVYTPRVEMHCVEASSFAFGLGRSRNLLYMRFVERTQGVR